MASSTQQPSRIRRNTNRNAQAERVIDPKWLATVEYAYGQATSWLSHQIEKHAPLLDSAELALEGLKARYNSAADDAQRAAIQAQARPVRAERDRLRKFLADADDAARHWDALHSELCGSQAPAQPAVQDAFDE